MPFLPDRLKNKPLPTAQAGRQCGWSQTVPIGAGPDSTRESVSAHLYVLRIESASAM